MTLAKVKKYRFIDLIEFKNRLEKLNKHHIKLLDSSYVNITTKATFIDSEFGSWMAFPRNVLSGREHPERGKKKIQNKKLISINEVKRRVQKAHGDIVNLDVSTYVRCDIKARFVDIEFGEWWTTPSSVFNGTSHPLRGLLKLKKNVSMSICDFHSRLKEMKSDISIVDSTFVNATTKATFIDPVYGEWQSTPSNVLSGREHPRKKYIKASRTMKKYEPLKHWKTDELCFIQSSYEHIVLSWLNDEKIDYRWQVPLLTNLLTPKGKPSLYIVDLQILSGQFEGRFVEIKGTWDRVSGLNYPQRKWDWLRLTYPNSLLWMRHELISLNIMTKSRVAAATRARVL